MKPSFKPVIIPSQKLSDGTYNVKIRVTYKRQSKRLSTQLYAAPSDLNKEKKLKEGGSVWKRAYDFIGELLQETVFPEGLIMNYDVKRFKEYLNL